MEKLKAHLKRFGILLIGGWCMLAFVGYGLALKNYASDFHQNPVDINHHRAVEGPVKSISGGTFGDYHIRLEGSEEDYVVPRGHVPTAAGWSRIADIVKRGQPIWIATRPGDNIVIGMAKDYGKGTELGLVYYRDSEAYAQAEAVRISDRGSFYLMLGLFAIPGVTIVMRLAQWLIERRSERRSGRKIAKA